MSRNRQDRKLARLDTCAWLRELHSSQLTPGVGNINRRVFWGWWSWWWRDTWREKRKYKGKNKWKWKKLSRKCKWWKWRRWKE